MNALSFRGAAGLFAAGLLVLGAGCGAAATGPGNDAGSEGGGTGPICPTVMDDLLSDFKLHNGIHAADGRVGGWYTYGDKSGFGILDPAEGGTASVDLNMGNTDCSGAGSLRVKGMGFADWGAAVGTDFMPRGMTTTSMFTTKPKGTYNASKYKGVSFFARASAPVKFVMVKFLDPYTDRDSILPDADWCVYDAMMPTKNCSPYIVKFGYGYAGDDDAANLADYPAYHDYRIDTNWKRFEILFAHTKQDRYNLGQQSPGNKLATDQLMGMAIQVNSDRTTMPGMILPNDFEIWIDDVTFIK